MLRKNILFLLLLSLLFGGCDCRRQSRSSMLLDDNSGFFAFEQQAEVLASCLELLDSLEEYPSLPGMPGAERLIQTADRLNKWIVDRPADPNWTSDESLLALEESTNRCSVTARNVVKLLRILQGGTGGEQTEAPLPASLDDERKQIVRLLAQLDGELRTFAALCEIDDRDVLWPSIQDLQKNFSNLDSISNLTSARIRTFAQRWEAETQQLALFADRWERLAFEFRIQGLFIQPSDIDYLKQRVWMRNITAWARSESALPLQRAKTLFDWTVRNIEIRSEAMLLPQYPWQTLLIGAGSMWDRAWVFMELLQEERIDSCILSVPHPENPQARLDWAVGVLIDDEIYLFLPYHGLPVPGPGGLVLAENGELDCKDVATLSEVIRDDSLLRQLDLSDSKFPLSADDVKHSTAHLLATPSVVSHRMKVFEAALDSTQSMVLYVDLKQQQRLFSTIPNIDRIELWKHPYRTMYGQLFGTGMTNAQLATMFRPLNVKRLLRDIKKIQDQLSQMQGKQAAMDVDAAAEPDPRGRNDTIDQSISEKNDFGLWSGRILYFKGRITGQESAATNLAGACSSDIDLLELRNLPPPFKLDPEREHEMIVDSRRTTLNAVYWLGLTSYETGSVAAAKGHWEGRDISKPNPWSNGVQYMLGRVAEREKNYEKAAAHFEKAVSSPSATGNLLRAKWLREIMPQEK